MRIMKTEIKFEYLNDYFIYDGTSPSCLRWRVDKGRGRYKRFAGDIAGSLKTYKNYSRWVVEVNDVKYKAHRVVYSLSKRVDIPPEMEIDHIDGNPCNNKIENLRLVSHLHNCRNKRATKLPKSKVMGICKRGNEFYYIQWKEYDKDLNFKVKTKYFSIKTMGEDAALNAAIKFREENVARLNSLGYGFTERHNKM